MLKLPDLLYTIKQAIKPKIIQDDNPIYIDSPTVSINSIKSLEKFLQLEYLKETGLYDKFLDDEYYEFDRYPFHINTMKRKYGTVFCKTWLENKIYNYFLGKGVIDQTDIEYIQEELENSNCDINLDTLVKNVQKVINMNKAVYEYFFKKEY